MFMDPTYLLLVALPGLLLSLFARWKVESSLRTWSQIGNERGLTGVDTARIIMQQAGLDHVTVDRVQGELTDFYDPRDKSIHLSDTSTSSPSVASMAIVAHELGHAQQDRAGNFLLGVRASLAPAVGLGTQLGLLLVIAGVFTRLTGLAWLGIGLFSLFVAFTLVTLPVEFDASRRALGFLDQFGLVSPRERDGARSVLTAAALTYVAAAAAAILQLLYWVSLVQGRNRR